MGEGVPSGIARKLIGGIGHQGHLCGPHLAHQFHKRRARLPLNIELRSKPGLQVVYITVSDVALIGAGMHRDTLRSETFTVERYSQHIGIVSSSGISQGCHLVDIHT